MLYIVAALSAEARPIVEEYRLKRVHSLPFTLFENEEIKLIISGMGILNAMMATSALLGHCPPNENDLLVNIGICAAPKNFEIGEALLIHKINYKEHSYFPDILFEHQLKESDILSVDEPVENDLQTPVDMESYGVYKAASRFFRTHQILFFKIVSDHFEPQCVTKELAQELISKNMPDLEQVLSSARYVIKKGEIFTADEKELIQEISEQLTKAQSDRFVDACYYYKFHRGQPLYPKGTLHESGIKLPDEKLSKLQRSEYLEQLIKTLTL